MAMAGKPKNSDTSKRLNRDLAHDDEWTRFAVEALREVFETDLDAYFVSSGTAANCLALASMVQPWQASANVFQVEPVIVKPK